RLEAAGEGIRVTLYASGKLLLQGKRAREVRGELDAFGLLGAPAAPANAPEGPLIGTDETGKGDYFGPLVVAAAYVAERSWGALRELGVRDSKLLADGFVHKIEPEVRRLCPHEVVVVS